jgi:preprotein translocase subunit SecD
MPRGKWLLIAGVTAAAVISFFALGVPLGLDLKGGIQLEIRVQTEDAVRAELEDAVSRLRLSLDSKKIGYQTVEPVIDADAGLHRLVVRGVKDEDQDRARKVLDATLREFARSVAGGDLVADIPANVLAGIRSTTVEHALTTIGERVNATGVAEPRIQRQGLGGERILIELPGVEDPEHVKRLIGRVALLQLKLVAAGPFPTRDAAIARYQGEAPDGQVPPSLELVEGSDEQGATVYYVVDRAPVISGRDLSRALPGRDDLGQPAVDFTLTAEAAKRFGEVTGKNVGRQLAIILDSNVKSAPVIRSRINDRGQIEGGFTQEEARDLSLVLRAGALPAKIQYLHESTIGPFLGRDSIRKGTFAGLAGLVLIVVAMLFYYRRSGINAVTALVLNAVLLFGALALLRATLTLPGIAGIILTLGMAVDANVLVFEAIREGLRLGVTPKRAIEDGFARALTTIVDSNLTTMLAAGALWMLGSGPVRGFGVTLLIGLLISMFTAYYVSKAMFETFVLSREWKPGQQLSI